MLAAQVVEFNKPYKVQSVPTPTQLEPFEMLVRIAVASFCHTDMMVTEGIFGSKLPITASHEGVGTVVATGSDVTEFKAGDRVMNGQAYGRCYKCTNCQTPDTQYCMEIQGGHGLSRDGAFAEYQVVDSREASPLPDNLSFQSAAPLSCAGITVYAALKRLNLKPGEWIAIVGAGGGLGHIAVQLAKFMNLKVLAVDARDQGLQLAKECGADVLVDARESTESVISKVLTATGTPRGKGIVIGGVDGTLNLSDASSAATEACAITKMHGTVIQIAQPTPNFSIPFQQLIFRDVRVVGSLTASKEQTREMLKLISRSDFKVRTNAFNGFDEVEKMVDFAHSGKMAGKAVLIIDEETVRKEAIASKI